MMYGLKRPQQLACGCLERHYGVRVAIVTGAETAVEIGRGATCGDEDHVAVDIDGHWRPCVSGARLAWRRRIPTPFRLAGLKLEGANNTTLRLGTAVIADGGTHNDGAAHNCWRRSDLEIPILQISSGDESLPEA